jgi:lipopolysaccharide export system protein LptA
MEGDESVLVATGNVKIIHGSTTITCKEARSYENKKMAILEKNVVVVDEEGGYHLDAGYVEYYRKEKHSIATKEPVLLLTKRKDRPIRIESVFMEMFQKKDIGIAKGNVWIYQEDITAQCDKCTYFGKEDRIILEGEPVAWKEDSRLAGDTITLILEEDVVKEIHVNDNTRMIYYSYEEEQNIDESDEEDLSDEDMPDDKDVSTDDTVNEKKDETEEITDVIKTNSENHSEVDENEVSEDKEINDEKEEKVIIGRVETAGDKMIAYFEDENIKRLIIEGNAEGIYYPYKDNQETGESVFTSGDVIDVYINNENIDLIRITGDAVGVYNPGENKESLTKTFGRIMVIYMAEDGEVDRIIVRGNAKGIYMHKEKKEVEG